MDEMTEDFGISREAIVQGLQFEGVGHRGVKLGDFLLGQEHAQDHPIGLTHFAPAILQ